MLNALVVIFAVANVQRKREKNNHRKQIGLINWGQQKRTQENSWYNFYPPIVYSVYLQWLYDDWCWGEWGGDSNVDSNVIGCDSNK